MKQTPESALSTWKSYLGLSEAEIRQRFPMDECHVQRDGFYGNLKNLTVIYNPETCPGIFYLKNDTCLLFYRQADEDPDGMALADITPLLGEPAADLTSRAGKQSTLYVYPAQGVALSTRDGAVEFLEIFAPLTLKDYLTRFYRKPGPFIR
ncbi:MAG TPA: hypothetical protein PKW33_06580 [Anaerolineaceae bacterium]|nr:hypothetical protein [Anaerolineaceae bacterium]HPN51234.1 hypothetical protein [Anaerolineaceae bacterium]